MNEELFDFPCSRSFRGYEAELNGETLPSLESRTQIVNDGTQNVYDNSKDNKWIPRQWDIVNQLRGEVTFLSNKVMEMRAKAKEDASDSL